MIQIDKIKSNLSSTDQFLIENYKKCSIHSKKQLVMVRVDDEQEQNQLECLHCVYRQQNKQYLPLELIIDSNEQTIFKGWPVFDDSQIYENLLEATEQESFKEENIQEVKIFFKELRAQVFELIEQKESELLQIVEQKSNTNAKILEEYNQLSQKERLKDIILNKFQDLESQDKILKDLIRENKLNQQRNKARLEDILATQRLFKIDMTPYNQIKDNLVGIINGINSNIKKSLNIQQISEQVVQGSLIPILNRNYIEVSQIEDLPNCKNYENIKMNFKEKNIGKQEITLICNALSNCSSVKTLELNFQKALQSVDDLQLISNVIQKFKEIKELSLVLKHSIVNDQHLLSIEKAIQKHQFDKLQLNLANNNITAQGALYIQNMVERLPNISNLSINLNGNRIQDEGVKQIASALELNQNITNVNIDFKFNQIQDEGVNDIITALQKCNGITNLKLDLRNNSITEIAKRNLKSALEIHNHTCNSCCFTTEEIIEVVLLIEILQPSTEQKTNRKRNLANPMESEMKSNFKRVREVKSILGQTKKQKTEFILQSYEYYHIGKSFYSKQLSSHFGDSP
ncbi:hypothetical protein ABPG74_006771 [Tetrahymena malaccensis]